MHKYRVHKHLRMCIIMCAVSLLMSEGWKLSQGRPWQARSSVASHGQPPVRDPRVTHDGAFNNVPKRRPSQWDTPMEMTETTYATAGGQLGLQSQQPTAATRGHSVIRWKQTSNTRSFMGQNAALRCKKRCHFNVGIVLTDVELWKNLWLDLKERLTT